MTAGDLSAQLERLAERTEAWGEEAPAPRSALPALFRALRAALPPEREAAVSALARRLPDRRLLDPTLEVIEELRLEEPWVKDVVAANDRDAWCSIKQVARLASTGAPAWFVRLLRALLTEAADPTDLALEVDVADLCDALRDAIELRLRSPARRRCRTSADLARGALRLLTAVAPDEGPVQAAAGRVLAAETRRAGKGEPTLALEALAAVERSPALSRIRLLEPLVGALKRRKVELRAREVLDAAIAEAGLTPEEVQELTARAGGAKDDGWVHVALEEGGECLLRIGADCAVERSGDPPTDEDRRALENAERRLTTEWRAHAARLERALGRGRAWRVPLWREVFRHPLLGDLARRLVWEVTAQGARIPFAWDGAPTDLFGDPVALGDGDAIRLLHPTTLDADELELWRERALEPARPVAPFPQLFRDVLAPSDDPLTRFADRQAYKDEVEAMAQSSGWSGCPLLGSGPWELERSVAGLKVTIELDEVTIKWKPTLGQRKAAHRRARGGEKPRLSSPRDDRPRVRLSRLSAEGDGCVALAEVVRRLEHLTDPLASVDGLFLHAWQERKWRDAKAAWREVVLRYRQGSPALLAGRRALLEAYAAGEGLELRLEGRFLIADQHVVELGTGLCHEGPPKDHLPTWRADELAAEGSAGAPPLRFPFLRESAPETVAVIERALGLARLAARRSLEPTEGDDA